MEVDRGRGGDRTFLYVESGAIWPRIVGREREEKRG